MKDNKHKAILKVTNYPQFFEIDLDDNTCPNCGNILYDIEDNNKPEKSCIKTEGTDENGIVLLAICYN
jgi:hypothetical protein